MGRIDYLHDPDAPPANSVVPSVVVFVHEGEGGRLDTGGDAEAAGKSLDELRFAGAQISAQPEDRAWSGLGSPKFTEFCGLFGAI